MRTGGLAHFGSVSDRMGPTVKAKQALLTPRYAGDSGGSQGAVSQELEWLKDTQGADRGAQGHAGQNWGRRAKFLHNAVAQSLRIALTSFRKINDLACEHSERA
jgi:hypothetical protein